MEQRNSVRYNAIYLHTVTALIERWCKQHGLEKNTRERGRQGKGRARIRWVKWRKRERGSAVSCKERNSSLVSWLHRSRKFYSLFSSSLPSICSVVLFLVSHHDSFSKLRAANLSPFLSLLQRHRIVWSQFLTATCLVLICFCLFLDLRAIPLLILLFSLLV